MPLGTAMAGRPGPRPQCLETTRAQAKAEAAGNYQWEGWVGKGPGAKMRHSEALGRNHGGATGSRLQVTTVAEFCLGGP